MRPFSMLPQKQCPSTTPDTCKSQARPRPPTLPIFYKNPPGFFALLGDKAESNGHLGYTIAYNSVL